MGRSELLLLVGGFAALCSSKSTDDGRLLSDEHDHEHGSGPHQEPPPDMEAMQEGKGGEQLSDGVVVGIVFGVVAFFVIAVLVARHFIDAKTAEEWKLPLSRTSFWGGTPKGEGADKPAVELK